MPRRWAGSSSAGLEDFIGFHASAAPSAYELGYYGVEGNGVDDHAIGKPSEGVHLSIEANWQTSPYNSRLGRDEFAPAQRWVAGAERWNLGNLAGGQSVSMDVLLTLRTGTRVITGAGTSGGCNGGSSVPGGVGYQFEDVTSEGSCFAEYSKADESEIALRIAEGEFAPFTFLTPGGPAQLWKIEFSGNYSGSVSLTFGYDATLLPSGFDESALSLYQFNGAAWVKLASTVDTLGHTLSVNTASLLAFVLGVDAASTFTVVASVAPANSGVITGAGAYADGSSATLAASANTGYAFSNWTENGAVVSSSPSHTFNVHADHVLVANFISVGAGRAITTSALPSNGGSTGGDGAYALGSSATVTTTPNAGYSFLNWTQNGTPVSTEAIYQFNVTGNRTLVAHIALGNLIRVSAEPANAGTAGGGGVYLEGASVTIEANANPGYVFLNWTENGDLVSTSPTYSFISDTNHTLAANFIAQPALATASPDPKS